VKRFCYSCGALESEDNPLVGGLCRRCLSSRPLLLLPKFEVVTCPRCGAVRVGGSWLGGGLEEGVRGLVLSRLRVAKLTDNTWEFVPVTQAGGVQVEAEAREGKNSVRVTVRVRMRVGGEQAPPLQQELVTEVPLRRETCKVCRLKAGGYYEAILQVRGKDVARIRGLVEEEARLASREDGRAFLTKVEEVEGGVDFYLSSATLARRLGRTLKRVHGAQLSESAKLVGQAGGRRRYRVSVLARLKSGQG
jgi:nonsense-mediated mRNA decay protein 3